MSEQNFAVRALNLTRTFLEGTRRHAVLDDLSIKLIEGETVALRGRSGSGKSTLLNCLSGIDSADSGSITIGDARIDLMSEYERTLFRRREIGFVYQAFNLVSTLSVGDNVRLVLELNGFKDDVANQRMCELLDAVGLLDRATSYPDILSGGEQQRVAVARALAHEPALVLADEPTGNLDATSAEQVLDLMDGLVRDSGRTMIIATHSLAVADRCDRVFELQDGRLKQL